MPPTSRHFQLIHQSVTAQHPVAFSGSAAYIAVGSTLAGFCQFPLLMLAGRGGAELPNNSQEF